MPPGRDSSLNLLVLVFVSCGVSLSHVDVAFNVLDLSECCWHYIGVSFSTTTFVFNLFIFRPWFPLWSTNCSMCCSSCGVLAQMSMLSVKRRWQDIRRLSPCLWFHKSVVGICFRVYKQLGRYDISLSYSSPDVGRVAFFVYVDCHRAVGVDFLHEFDVHMYPVLEAISVLLQFALSRRLSHKMCLTDWLILILRLIDWLISLTTRKLMLFKNGCHSYEFIKIHLIL